MFVYKNAKGATITTACELSGGGWEPLKKPEAKQETRTEEPKEAKPKRKKS